jgi:hypothetical protein
MSWLYSQALVEEYLGDTCLDGEPSVQSSGNPTQLAYCAPDKMTVFSRLSRFGMTYKPLTASRGEELLTLYLAAFHAKTSAQQEKALASQERAALCGNTWQGLLAKFDPLSSSWKTAQCSLLEDLEQSLETWPRWGSMRNGACYQRRESVRYISESVFGFSLPTPVASDATSGAVIGKNDTYYTTSMGLPRKVNQKGTDGSAGLGRLVRMWPTPKASDDKKARGNPFKNAQDTIRRGFSLSLPEAIAINKWPTLTVHGNNNRKGLSAKSGNGLATAVKLCPTPVADDTSHRKTEYAQGGTALSTTVGGQLNPTWVEWLMGWPLGWTDLKPLEMGKFRQWQQAHLQSLEASCDRR